MDALAVTYLIENKATTVLDKRERSRVTKLKREGAMNKLSWEKQAQIVAVPIEGNSIRATSRKCDMDKETVMKRKRMPVTRRQSIRTT